jgi:large-conductance mechanosensitive channel
MAVSALIAVRLAEVVVGLTAHERFRATQRLDHSSVMGSKWFIAAIVVVLVVSIIALVVVSLCRKVRELKAAEKAFSDNAARKRLTESETELLMAIAIKAGLKQSEDIFAMGETFEQGAGILFKESFSGGKPTTETSQLEKQLADLRGKLGFRKVSSSSAVGSAAKPVDKSAGAKPANSSVGRAAFIAMFPSAKRLEPAGNGNHQRPEQGGSPSPPELLTGVEWNQQLPVFLPAIITGLVGRVVSLETTLKANVGDRVLVVIGLASVGGGGQTLELIEDVGPVQQTTQPAELMKAPNARRLAVELAGLSEEQTAQLADAMRVAKATEAAKPSAGGSQETKDTAAKPVGAKEESK